MVEYHLSKKRFNRPVKTFKMLAEFCDEDSNFSINVHPCQGFEDIAIKFEWVKEHVQLGLLIITDFNKHEFIITGKLTKLGKDLKEKLNV